MQNLQAAGGLSVSKALLGDHVIDRALEQVQQKLTDFCVRNLRGNVQDALWVLAMEGGSADPFAFLDQEFRATIEIKQADMPGPGTLSPTLMSESTARMLTQMRAVLDREAARLGEEGLEGKAAVDLVSLIARTLEKIDQMERLIADDQANAAKQSLSPEDREALRNSVRQLILAAAERMVNERMVNERARQCDTDQFEENQADEG